MWLSTKFLVVGESSVIVKDAGFALWKASVYFLDRIGSFSINLTRSCRTSVCLIVSLV